MLTRGSARCSIVTLYSKTYGLRQAIPFLTYYVFSAGIMHVYNSTYDPSLAPTAKAHLHKCMRALQEMEITWPSASRQRELLLGLVDLRDVDIDIETTMSSATDQQGRGRKREAEHQDIDSRPGSGAATPAAISEAYRRVGRGGAIVPPFASSALGQTNAQGQQQNQPRRTASISAASSRRRHNSVTAATLRQNPGSGTGAGTLPPVMDSRSSSAQQQQQQQLSASSSHFPSTDFTFISPAAQPVNLPGTGIPAPSPALTSTSGFDFSGMSPGNAFASSSGFSIPPVSQQGQLTSSDGAHIHNILGLSGAMNIPYSPPDGSGAAMGQSLPNSADPAFSIQHDHTSLFNNAPSGTAFGNFTDLLADPFWLSMQQDINAAAQGQDQLNDATMVGQSDSPAMSGDQSSAFFGA